MRIEVNNLITFIILFVNLIITNMSFAQMNTRSNAQSNTQQKQKNILFIGDSQTVGEYGNRLDKNLRLINNAKVTTYGVCGASAANYLKTPSSSCGYFQHNSDGKLVKPAWDKVCKCVPKHTAPNIDKLLVNMDTNVSSKVKKPDIVIISLGSNSDKTKDFGKSVNKALMEKVLQSGAECVWVGPPKTRERTAVRLLGVYDGINEAIKELKLKYNKTCKFIDSRPHKPHDPVKEKDQILELGEYGVGSYYPNDGTGDGKHFTGVTNGTKLARAWADGVFEKFLELEKIQKPDTFQKTPCVHNKPKEDCAECDHANPNL